MDNIQCQPFKDWLRQFGRGATFAIEGTRGVVRNKSGREIGQLPDGHRIRSVNETGTERTWYLVPN